MLRVVLIDDEAVIRAGMRTIIDWASCGCEIVGEAGDGESGLALLEALAPDIALVDVKMPVLHGIDMIRMAQARALPTRFIVLSGYGDFAYTKQAIRLGVDAYLLKPVEEDELIETLRLMEEKLSQARRDMNDRREGQRGRIGERLRRLLEEEGAPLENAEAADMAALLGAPPYAAALMVPTGADARQKARAVAFFRAEGYFAYEADAVGLPLSQATASNRAAMVEGLRARLRMRMGMDAFFAVGEATPDLQGLHASWQGAQTVLANAFLFRDTPVVLADELRPAVRRGQAEAPLAQLAAAVQIHDQPGMDSALLALQTAFRDGLWPEQEIKTLASGLVVELLAQAQALPDADGLPDREDTLRALLASDSLARLLEVLQAALARIAACLGNADADTVVQRMVSYLDKHYAQRLTLDSLGTRFGYNGAYLGRIFKKHTGQSFPDYLETTRVERAKALLRQGVKVWRVAERVGFANQAYFSAKFKKRAGISPKDYMQACTDNERK